MDCGRSPDHHLHKPPTGFARQHSEKERRRNDRAQGCRRCRVAGRPRRAAPAREGPHPDGRRAGAPAPGAALGPDRQGLPLRHRRRHPDPGRAVRRPLPAAGLPLHVRPQLPGRRPGQLLHRRHPGRPAAPPAGPRRDPDLVSQAPLEKLQAYKRRMGWRLGWVSAAPSDFNLDLGASSTQELTPPGGLPPIVAQNAAAAGTDVVGYLSEAPVVSVFTLQDGVVYQSYATTWRGVEFLMGYYPILDRMPKGRDEGDAWQLWLRRHDEYNSQ